ncbi:hypothetical protein L6452_35030 [Arctium lappa]|uniref:Uncharacterized protein n=1 Tax=Arctium lappa TaxID=4217 RepID=A0ACB8YJS6_ARCLA|nr:hypothetical protein L6452_35030 [Arctium lappa]
MEPQLTSIPARKLIKLHVLYQVLRYTPIMHTLPALRTLATASSVNRCDGENTVLRWLRWNMLLKDDTRYMGRCSPVGFQGVDDVVQRLLVCKKPAHSLGEGV